MSIDNLWTAGGVVSIPLLGFSLLAISSNHRADNFLVASQK